MDQQTLDRACEIISDWPGITGDELTATLATPGCPGSKRTTRRITAWLRDRQHRIVGSGRGYFAVGQSGQSGQSGQVSGQTRQSGQHRDLKDLAQSGQISGQTGQSGQVANSKAKSIYTLPKKAASMGGEQQPTENGSQDTAAPLAYASGPLAEAAAPAEVNKTENQDADGQQLSP